MVTVNRFHLQLAALVLVLVGLASCETFARTFGQGGGRANTNSAKPAPKRTIPPRKPSGTTRPAPPSFRPTNPQIELVRIPAGSFMMGSNNGKADEKPVHQVTINYSFYMGKYEVTQAQWQAVMGNNPSNFKDCGGNCPVDQVSWDDAQNFINKLNQSNDGFRYRLPTEAEWEYACRAGTTGDYAGDLDSMAWYEVNSEGKTHPVGHKRPNAWGLYDMHGNQWEFCQDWYDANYYRNSPIADPQGPSRGQPSGRGLDGAMPQRVVRGGGETSDISRLRSAFRAGVNPIAIGYGLRVAAVRTQ
jgi:formylglycine-generating enzyme required for sulfatase activity